MIRNFLVVALALMLPVFSLMAQDKTITYLADGSGIPADRNIEVKAMWAYVTINPWKKTVIGKSGFFFKTLRSETDSFLVYTPEMKISSVTMNEEPCKFRMDHDNLVVYPNAKLPRSVDKYIDITYTVTNPRELHFTGWDDPTNRMRKQVWAHRPFGWVPFVDQMTKQSLKITFDKDYYVVANGDRGKAVDMGDTAITWEYTLPKPHPFYSMCLAIGQYEYKEMTTASKLPLELYYYPGMADRVEPTYRYQEQMFNFLERETNFSYPYMLYRNIPVNDYLYGAMETTTSTVFADFMLVDKRGFLGRNYINTNAHELAHQWFGNCVKNRTTRDLWLTESFATYYAKLFEKSIYGDLRFEAIRDAEMQKALKAGEADSYPLASGKAGVDRWYQKGSLVLEMMRDVCGDDEFRSGVKNYLDKRQFKEVESNDFLQALYEKSGRPMQWFFDQWIYRGGEPEFQVSWTDNKPAKQTKEVKNRSTLLQVEQVQKVTDLTGLFKVPVNIEVWYKDGSKDTRKIWVEQQKQEFEIANKNNKDVDFVIFDSGNRILKRMKYNRSATELLSQLAKATHPADRLEAVRALKDTPVAEKRPLYLKQFATESFALVKSEMVAQLFGDSLSTPLIKQAMADPDPQVRKTVTENLKTVPAYLLNDYEVLLGDSAYYIVESALVNLCNTPGMPVAQIDSYLERTKKETGWRGRNIRTAWLGIGLKIHPEKKEYLTELIDLASPSFDFETRTNALKQLKNLNYLDDQSALYLLKACVYWNWKLSAAAGDIFKDYIKLPEHRTLLEKAMKNKDFTDKDQETFKNLLK